MTDPITTPEALDALPVGSVVLDGMGDAWQRSDADTDWWAPANPFYAEADAATVLEQGGTEHPATLLHRPDRPSDLAAEVEHRGVVVDAYDVAHSPHAEEPDATRLEIEVGPTGAFAVGQRVRVEADR